MHFRKALPTDIDALNLLEETAFFGNKINPRQMKRFISSPLDHLLIAEDKGRLLGYALILFHRGTHLARLYSVAVDPDFRGKYIGQKLVTLCEQETLRRGYITLRLEVRSDNVAAIRLYKKMGYKVLETLVHYYDDLADGIRMDKRLDPPGPSITLKMPLYIQTTPFSCGPACLLMSFATLHQGYQPTRLEELRLWREATTIFMTSGHGGCSAHGLALAAIKRGYQIELWCQSASVPFIDSVRDINKKAVISLVHEDFCRRLMHKGIEVNNRAPTLKQLENWIIQGHCVLMLVSTYRFNGEKGPHWIILSGLNEQFFFFHDPHVDNHGDVTNSVYIPISKPELANVVKYGRQKQVSYLVIKTSAEPHPA
jgi:ribosomal protein S18 acetylase RimI-like enzyme